MKVFNLRICRSFIMVFLILATFRQMTVSMAQEKELLIQMSIEQALDQERLKYISNNPTVHGSGGLTMPLPDGTMITRDVIFEAIQPLLSEGQKIIPDLMKALKNKYVHIRYGAYLALKLITKTDIEYYPFLEPDNPKNVKAFEKLVQPNQ